MADKESGTTAVAAAATQQVTKETRCATCKRPYAAKLDECPFCAREKLLASSQAAPAARERAVSRSGRHFVAVVPDDDGDEGRGYKSVLVYGSPIVIGAAIGIALWVTTPRLGSDGPSGLFGPSIAAAAIVTPVLALGFVRRVYRTLTSAVDDLGIGKLIGIVGLVTAIAFTPTMFSMVGVMSWLNGTGIASREQIVQCRSGEPWHRATTPDDGWTIPYKCELDGDVLLGSVHQREKPPFTDGDPIRFKAARGRLGIWVRTSDAQTEAAVQPVSQ